MTSFREALQTGKFLVTVEASPPKGAVVEGFRKTLENLKGRVDAVNMPDGRSARIHMGPLAASLLARELGLEPILTMSCRDRNRLSLCSDLLGAHAMGLENVLCVSGDYFSFGDTPDAKPVYDLDSVQAIDMVRRMGEGIDSGENQLEGAPDFCVGCVANPQAAPAEPQLLKLEKKLEAGAEFIQTLDLYDLDRAFKFLERLGDRDTKVIAGLRFITEKEVELSKGGKMPGNRIPEELALEIGGLKETDRILDSAKARLVKMIGHIKSSGLCRGVHLTIDGYEELIPEIIQEAGI